MRKVLVRNVKTYHLALSSFWDGEYAKKVQGPEWLHMSSEDQLEWDFTLGWKRIQHGGQIAQE